MWCALIASNARSLYTTELTVLVSCCNPQLDTHLSNNIKKTFFFKFLICCERVKIKKTHLAWQEAHKEKGNRSHKSKSWLDGIVFCTTTCSVGEESWGLFNPHGRDARAPWGREISRVEGSIVSFQSVSNAQWAGPRIYNGLFEAYDRQFCCCINAVLVGFILLRAIASLP